MKGENIVVFERLAKILIVVAILFIIAGILYFL